MNSATVSFFVSLTVLLCGCSTTAVLTPAQTNKEETTFYSPDLLDVKPKPLSQTPPEYPPELRKARIQGVVYVQFTIDNSGIVRDVTTIRSPAPALSKLAEDAIAKWRFEPGMKGQRKVNCEMLVPITFASDGK